MVQNHSKYFKYFAGFISLFHFFIGIAGSLSSEWSQRVGKWVWGATIEVTPQYLYVSKLLNAYIIVFALVMMLLALNPLRYKKLVIVPIVAIALQLIQSIVFFDGMNAAFQIEPARNIQNIVFSAILLIGILLLRPKGNNEGQ